MTQAIEERSAAVRIGFMFSTMPDGRIRLHDLSLEFVKEQAARSGGETALHQDSPVAVCPQLATASACTSGSCPFSH